MQIKTKKGDIPVTILVLMVVLICIMTILSFSYASVSANHSFLGIGLIETTKAFAYQHSFFDKTGFTSLQGNSFSSSGVQITKTGNNIEARYSEKNIPLIGSEKTVVYITYQR